MVRADLIVERDEFKDSDNKSITEAVFGGVKCEVKMTDKHRLQSVIPYGTKINVTSRIENEPFHFVKDDNDMHWKIIGGNVSKEELDRLKFNRIDKKH